MKKLKPLSASALALCVLLSGCGGITSPETPVSSGDFISQTAPDTSAASQAELQTATLYTNMEFGSESAQFETHSFEYSGDLTVEKLADGLSTLTGLDFSVQELPSDRAEGITVDWAANSTLIANLDDREQKEDFFLYDVDSMRWFMMDSLWRTLTENFGVEEIYYTMDEGQDLAFDALYPINIFPCDTPYMGSAFYYAHSDVAGDAAIDEDTAFTLVQNVIDLQGKDLPVIILNGDDTIGGEHAYTFEAGCYSADGTKFTALVHYAVTDSKAVYYMDPLEGADWVLFDTQSMG